MARPGSLRGRNPVEDQVAQLRALVRGLMIGRVDSNSIEARPFFRVHGTRGSSSSW